MLIKKEKSSDEIKNTLNFLLEISKLKGKKRRGWIIHQIKNSETAAEHIFHLAILVWILGKRKKINLEKAIKMALIHDLCEVYAEDLTPYDPLLPKDKKKIREILKRWPKFTSTLKKKKEKKKNTAETKAFEKLIAVCPKEFKGEVKNLWMDFSRRLSKEARFVKQADKMVNFLQGIEYWKKYGKIQYRLWTRWIKEIIDDSTLLEFINAIEEKFFKK